MVFVKKAKKYARGVAKRGMRMAKKRYVTKGGPNVKNIANDVMMLKSLLNVEKKRVDVTVAATSFGQTNGVGVSGGSCLILTPTIAQGTTGATRNGNSVKLVSGCLDVYLNQSVNTINQLKIRYCIFCKPDNSTTTPGATAYGQFYESNPFSTVIDFHSNRDPEFFNAYKVIKSGVVTLQQDQLAAGIAYAQLKVPMKFNHHLKYNSDASTVTTKNQFYIVFTSDTGDLAALTGAQFQYNMRWYFTDN